MHPGFGLANLRQYAGSQHHVDLEVTIPALARAAGYALAAAVVGAGIVLTGPSPGVGWTLIVFGGWLAAHTAEGSNPRAGKADTAGSASRTSRWDRADRRIQHTRGQWRAGAAGRRPRGPRSTAR
jgi:hypothetical protein